MSEQQQKNFGHVPIQSVVKTLFCSLCSFQIIMYDSWIYFLLLDNIFLPFPPLFLLCDFLWMVCGSHSIWNQDSFWPRIHRGFPLPNWMSMWQSVWWVPERKKKYRRCQQVSKKYGTGRDWTNLEIDKMGMWVFLQFKHFSFLGQSKTTDKASSSLFIGVNCNFSWDSMN